MWEPVYVIDKLDHEKMQELLVCEHGSINESYVDIYSLTGEGHLEWLARQHSDSEIHRLRADIHLHQKLSYFEE